MDLLVKNVPPELHERLRRHARVCGRTISEVVLDTVESELARQEWQERFARRPATRLDISAAQMLELERLDHDERLGWSDQRSWLMPRRRRLWRGWRLIRDAPGWN